MAVRGHEMTAGTSYVATFGRLLIAIACLCALASDESFAVRKWAIRHETLELFDATRQRAVSVDLAVRGDYEMRANTGLWKLPIAIISNGNTVKTLNIHSSLKSLRREAIWLPASSKTFQLIRRL
jgi:hypothetical protein